jgi:hypothetical protein
MHGACPQLKTAIAQRRDAAKGLLEPVYLKQEFHDFASSSSTRHRGSNNPHCLLGWLI